MLFRLLVSFLTFSLTACAATDTAFVPDTEGTAYLGGQWFDGSRFERRDVWVVDGMLSDAPPGQIVGTVDLSDQFVIPPLADGHNHGLQAAWRSEEREKELVEAGTLYTLQLCAHDEGIEQVRGALGSDGPLTIRFAQACLTASDGHPVGISLSGMKEAGIAATPQMIYDRFVFVVDTEAELREKWPRIADGTSLLKVILVDSERFDERKEREGSFGYNGFDPGLMPLLGELAERDGVTIAAHVETATDFRVAINSGVSIIAHMPTYRLKEGWNEDDVLLTEADAGDAARNGAVVITTAALAERFEEREPNRYARIRQVQAANLRTLRDAGVALAVGVDNPFGAVADEVEYLAGLDVFDPAELLSLATVETTRHLFGGTSDRPLMAGSPAEFVVLSEDPLNDGIALRSVALVVRDGMPAFDREKSRPTKSEVSER